MLFRWNSRLKPCAGLNTLFTKIKTSVRESHSSWISLIRLESLAYEWNIRMQVILYPTFVFKLDDYAESNVDMFSKASGTCGVLNELDINYV